MFCCASSMFCIPPNVVAGECGVVEVLFAVEEVFVAGLFELLLVPPPVELVLKNVLPGKSKFPESCVLEAVVRVRGMLIILI